jgi:hypothetical protein
VFAQAAQLNAALVEATVDPLEGEGLEGVPGVGQTPIAMVAVLLFAEPQELDTLTQ